MKEEIYKIIESKKNRIIGIRRYLHEHPEISFDEVNTSNYILEFYKGKDCEVKKNIGGNGIVVTINSGHPGKTIALRADFDALPINEETNVEYKSKNKGIMHACGHDAHTAYMLILAETLIEIKDKLNGKIVILHQPAEEVPPGGAKAMIDDGCLNGIDNVLGVHLWATEKCGVVHCTVGNIMASRSSIKIKLKGKGGHGSAPHLSNDTVVAASYFISIIQTIISRRIDPFKMATLTIGNFDGRGTPNIIKDSILLEGDVRTMDDDVKLLIEKEVKNVLDGLKIIFNLEYELFYEHDYPVLYNDEKFTNFIKKSIQECNLIDIKDLKTNIRNSASEDFAYYAQKVPSTFLFVGAMPDNGESYPHHHPKFNINEKSMLITAKLVSGIIIDYIKNNKS